MAIPGSILNQRITTSQSRSMYTSLCTVRDRNPTVGGDGQDVDNPTDVIGMVAIPCRLSPIIQIRPTDTEARRNQITEQNESRQCALFGLFNVDPTTQQAVVDGVVFRIEGVEFDGEPINTRLRLQIVRP